MHSPPHVKALADDSADAPVVVLNLAAQETTVHPIQAAIQSADKSLEAAIASAQSEQMLRNRILSAEEMSGIAEQTQGLEASMDLFGGIGLLLVALVALFVKRQVFHKKKQATEEDSAYDLLLDHQ